MTNTRVTLNRSQIMARIRGRDTGPELLLRRAVWSLGLRYRLQRRVLGTRPDFVFQNAKIAIYVDGCFWHGCPVHHVKPKTNREFWEKKIEGNIRRDRESTASLEESGWQVLRFWEHEVEASAIDCAEQIKAAVENRRAIRGKCR